MKKLFLFLLSIILFSCEKQEPILEPPKCKECITFVYYSDGTNESYLLFSCNQEEITKREKLNFITTEGGKRVIYMTTCYYLECEKCK
jgi:hypothetical protein